MQAHSDPKRAAMAVWKAILRNHPFFKAGGAFGFDWRTFCACYPADCAILRHAVAVASAR
jgi:hypothetical protein